MRIRFSSVLVLITTYLSFSNPLNISTEPQLRNVVELTVKKYYELQLQSGHIVPHLINVVTTGCVHDGTCIGGWNFSSSKTEDKICIPIGQRKLITIYSKKDPRKAEYIYGPSIQDNLTLDLLQYLNLTKLDYNAEDDIGTRIMLAQESILILNSSEGYLGPLFEIASNLNLTDVDRFSSLHPLCYFHENAATLYLTYSGSDLYLYNEFYYFASWLYNNYESYGVVFTKHAIQPTLLEELQRELQIVNTHVLEESSSYGYKTSSRSNAGQTNTGRLSDSSAVLLTIACVVGGVLLLAQLAFRKDVYSRAWKIDGSEILIASSDRHKTLVSSGNMQSHWQMAAYQNRRVVLIPPEVKRIAFIEKLSNEIQSKISDMRLQIINANVTRFYGFTEVDSRVFAVCDLGGVQSLRNVLSSKDYSLQTPFRNSLIHDLASGLVFLHEEKLVHGHLRTDLCYLDSHWQVKICDWQRSLGDRLMELNTEAKNERLAAAAARRSGGSQYDFSKMSLNGPRVGTVDSGSVSDMHLGGQASKEDKDFSIICREKNLKSADILPELFRSPKQLAHFNAVTPNMTDDIYSLSMIIFEVFERAPPFSYEIDKVTNTPALVERIVSGQRKPKLIKTAGQTKDRITKLLWDSWNYDEELRPTASELKRVLKALLPPPKSLVEIMLRTLTKYSDNLQTTQHDLKEAKQRVEALIYRIFPKKVADQLKTGEPVEPEVFSSVTMFFMDIVGFTTLSSRSRPEEIIYMLNLLFYSFDQIIERLDVYKLETIGDCYICVSGLPERNGTRHAREICEMAVAMKEYVRLKFRVPHMPGYQLQVRMGINSGSIVAGIVGFECPKYVCLGDTINTASRMESSSEPMKIQITEDTKTLLLEFPGFRVQERGVVQIKGKGQLRTFWLLSKEGSRVIDDVMAGNIGLIDTIGQQSAD